MNGLPTETKQFGGLAHYHVHKKRLTDRHSSHCYSCWQDILSKDSLVVLTLSEKLLQQRY